MSTLPPPTSGRKPAPGRRPGQVQDTPTSRATLAVILVGVVAAAALVIGVALVIRGADEDVAVGPGAGAPTTVASGRPTTTTTPTRARYGTGECPPDGGVDTPRRTFDDAPRRCIIPSRTYRMVVRTNRGGFTVALDAAAAPINVNNVVTLARWGYYDGTRCHRVVADFMVQCGRPGNDDEAPGYSVPDELPAAGEYTEGVVAMAAIQGTPDSAGGQWFVVVGPKALDLPPEYTIIGRVTKGYARTLGAIEALAGPDADNGIPPTGRITIQSVRITESG